MDLPSAPPLPPNQPGTPPTRSPSQRANFRGAMGTLVAAVVCSLITLAMWILPLVLVGDETESGLVILILMISGIPAMLAAVLFLVAIIWFVVAAIGQRPK